MTRKEKIERLVSIYTKLYKNEEGGAYDCPSAATYWASMSPGELHAELTEAEAKFEAQYSR